MSILVDTNILLRRTQPAHEHHRVAVESVAKLLGDGERLCYTPQNIAEFWNVATRPADKNGMGLPVALVRAEVVKIESLLTLLPDSSLAYVQWKRLVLRHEVQGVQVHDARLVALMSVHGVRRILTFNTGDFTRYDIEVLQPASIVTA
jgi:predicted nucleic acid-binding protein